MTYLGQGFGPGFNFFQEANMPFSCVRFVSLFELMLDVQVNSNGHVGT